MTQDRVSGAAANDWGLATARVIASKIGAVMKGRTSNEATLDSKTVVIKCAASATDSVGVHSRCLIVLIQSSAHFSSMMDPLKSGRCHRRNISQEMRDTRSRGSSAGKVGIVRKDFFEKSGRLLDRIKLDAAELKQSAAAESQ